MARKQKKNSSRTAASLQQPAKNVPLGSERPDPGERPELRVVVSELMANRPGLIGFLMSMAQLPAHGAWISFVWYLSSSGRAASLNSDSWQSWVVVGVLGFSLLLTFVSLFVCLFYGLRKPPRVLAAVGFFVSFFVGILASAIVFMTGLRAMST